ncbi:hypothetical protein L1049_003319 [Liquidambar formosana]|uniref:Late embryogenesis abundant protein At5g17165-like n=1 Tax=Liquidambar formosana TaxID=63359 RepID=A0AAP0R811_LIQFO
MAANSKSRGIVSFGKQYVNQIWTGNSRDPTHFSSLSASAATFRRNINSSVYEKNPDDQIRPHEVPDDVIQPESDKYWGPHPRTGVFGPETEHNPTAGEHNPTTNGGADSVLEQKAWFRPTSLEDLEKPHQP